MILYRHVFTPAIVTRAKVKDAVKTHDFVFLGGVMVSVLFIGPTVRELKLGPGRWIFRGYKNPKQDFFRIGSTTVGTMS
jgi:hypothetical protein